MKTPLRTSEEVNNRLGEVGVELSDYGRLRKPYNTRRIEELAAEETQLKTELAAAYEREGQQKLEREKREHPDRFERDEDGNVVRKMQALP